MYENSASKASFLQLNVGIIAEVFYYLTRFVPIKPLICSLGDLLEMNEQIVECIANYSEARNPEIILEIIDSIKSVSNVFLLDRHSDEDQNLTSGVYFYKLKAGNYIETKKMILLK